jgi:hypothetical protein
VHLPLDERSSCPRAAEGADLTRARGFGSGLPADRELGEPAEDEGVAPLGAAVELELGKGSEEGGDGELSLEAGEGGAEAVVDAG